MSWYMEPVEILFTFQFSKSDFTLVFGYICSEVAELWIFTVISSIG
jgi:hypothetical protein